MRAFRMIACIVSLSLSATAIAQSNKPQEETVEQKRAKEELEKKALALVEEIIKELSSLRLPENRILAQATLGDLLWKHDEKRARAFFRQSLDQLSDIDETRKQELNPINALQSNLIHQSRSQLRQEVVQMVARRDARLARDFLRGIRRNNTDPRHYQGRYDETAAQEINLASQILQTDPKEAFEIAQEHLEKGFHQGLIQLLLQLRTKDAQLGDRLADAVVKKIRSASLTQDYPAASFALMLLRAALHPGEDDDEEDAPRAPKPTTALLDESTIRELLSLVVNAALSRPNGSKKEHTDEDEEPGGFLLMELESMVKDVEKYVPARASALRARIAEISEDEDPEEKKAAELEAVMENGSPEAMLEAAAKAPDEMRENLYQQAAMKAFAAGNSDKAKQIINEHLSDAERRDQMIAYFTQQEIWRAATEGKIEQARQLMAEVSAEQRPAVLTQLASVIAGKGDKKLAAQLLNEAREMISGQPSNFIELMTLLEIARVYNSVEAAKGFEILDPLVEQLNALLGAAALLDGFEFTRHFKDGEMLPYSSSMLINMTRMCANNNGRLARSDFDRAKATADRFQRNDARLMARLAIAQGALSDTIETESSLSLLNGFYRGMIH